MQDLPVMHWIPKKQKTSISFGFIIAFPVFSIKPLSKEITSIFKLFYEKVEKYYTKGKVWSGIKTFWTIQKSYPVISSIDKLRNVMQQKVCQLLILQRVILKYLMTNYCMF